VDIVCLTVDCADPAALAGFWRDALGWPDVRVAADRSGASVHPAGGGTYLELVRVPEPKSGKNRLHLGLTAGALDALDAEIDRLRALGATVAWEEDFGPEIATRYRNVVLRDIEGNEFCLSGGAF
jgi:hypothetical protein